MDFHQLETDAEGSHCLHCPNLTSCRILRSCMELVDAEAFRHVGTVAWKHYQSLKSEYLMKTTAEAERSTRYCSLSQMSHSAVSDLQEAAAAVFNDKPPSKEARADDKEATKPCYTSRVLRYERMELESAS